MILDSDKKLLKKYRHIIAALISYSTAILRRLPLFKLFKTLKTISRISANSTWTSLGNAA